MAVPALAAAAAAGAAAEPLFPGFTAGFQGLMQRSAANGELPLGAASLPGEASQLLTVANFARDNVVWSDVETTKGQYNFSHTDALLAEYHAVPGLPAPRWMATLAYSNPLYDNGGPPASPEAVDAFVAFTVAAVRRYKGRGILWELWCEPNGVFWDGGPGNVTQYVALAVAVGKGIAAAGLQDEVFIGPNTAMWWTYDIDLPFLEACLKGGVLEYWGAINGHFYRATSPETVQDTYRKMRELVARYLPKGRAMPPLISGEWGYSNCVAPCGYYPYTGNVDAQTQGKYLARQWLVNAAEGVASIWCTFLDTSADPGDMILGVVEAAYGSAALPHKPKPAYEAAQTIMSLLRGANWPTRLNATFGKRAATSMPLLLDGAGGWRAAAGLLPPSAARAAATAPAVGAAADPPRDATDPDGVSVMGYADLPASSVGSALYVLRFDHPQHAASAGSGSTYAVWSIAGPTSVAFPVAEGGTACFRVTEVFGAARGGGAPVCADGNGVLTVANVTDAPVFLSRASYRPS